MELIFHHTDYERLEVEAAYSHGFPADLVARYRACLQLLRAACDEGDLTAMRYLGFRPLDQPPGRKYSVRLNNQSQLIVELQTQSPTVALRIMEIRMDKALP
jgi:plasmid maintenance system killer protein